MEFSETRDVDSQTTLVTVIQLTRSDFRTLFKPSVSQKWGYFIDRNMNSVIHRFSNWTVYPSGDCLLTANPEAIDAGVLSESGKYLFTASSDQSIRKWDLSQDKYPRRCSGEWKAHSDVINCLSFRSGLLVSGDLTGCIRLWNPFMDGIMIHEYDAGSEAAVISLDFNHDGQRIVSAYSDGSIRLWIRDSGECARMLQSTHYWANSVLFIGHLIISGCQDRSVKIWAPDLEEESHLSLQCIKEGILSAVDGTALNCDGSLLACFSETSVIIYQWPRMKVERKVKVMPVCGCFHPLRPHILAVVGYLGQRVRVYNPSSFESDSMSVDGKKGSGVIDIGSIIDSHRSKTTHICFNPCGSHIISVSLDKTARIWDVSHL